MNVLLKNTACERKQRCIWSEKTNTIIGEILAWAGLEPRTSHTLCETCITNLPSLRICFSTLFNLIPARDTIPALIEGWLLSINCNVYTCWHAVSLINDVKWHNVKSRLSKHFNVVIKIWNMEVVIKLRKIDPFYQLFTKSKVRFSEACSCILMNRCSTPISAYKEAINDGIKLSAISIC